MGGSGGAPEAPPFFIVGSARSGTTLLRLMLNTHSRVGIPPESRFITELYEGDEVDTEDFLARLEAHERFKLWELPIEAVRSELSPGAEGRLSPLERHTVATRRRLGYAEAAAAPFLAWARRRAKPRWGDKTPRYVVHIPLLSRLWPGARFVHLVRDGRNVALSYADVPFGPRTVAGAAELWARRVRAGIDAGRALGRQRYLELHYEDLVTDPSDHARSLCDFLDLDYEPGMLDYARTAKELVMPWASEGNPNVLRPPTTDLRAWEESMPLSRVEVFEAVAGDVLSELGYSRRFPAPSFAARLRGKLGRLELTRNRFRGAGA